MFEKKNYWIVQDPSKLDLKHCCDNDEYWTEEYANLSL